MNRLTILSIVILSLIGWIYIGANDYVCYLLYLVFIIENGIIILSLSSINNLRLNLPYLYLFVTWLLFNSLGFIHSALIDKHFSGKFVYEVYVTFIISSLLLYLPIFRKIKKRKHRDLECEKSIFNLNPKIILTIILLGILLQLYKIYSAGGLLAFFFARYGEKTDSSLATFFDLFGGILAAATSFLLPYICLKGNGFIRIIAILYFVFNVLMAAAGGASLALFSPVVSIFLFLFFINNDKMKRRKLKIVSLGLLVFAIIVGMIIRINRKSMEDFEFNGLSNAVEDIMESPTFDNVYNLNLIIEKVEPIYSPEQFVLPYVHMIPRAIFPWKPMELGRIVGMEFVGTTEESMAGFITSPMGDFYYDFGIIGIIVGMLFCGMVVGNITEYLNKKTLTPYTLSLTISVSGCFFGLYGWYTGCFSGLVKLGIALLFISILNKLFKPNTNDKLSVY